MAGRWVSMSQAQLRLWAVEGAGANQDAHRRALPTLPLPPARRVEWGTPGHRPPPLPQQVPEQLHAVGYSWFVGICFLPRGVPACLCSRCSVMCGQ